MKIVARFTAIAGLAFAAPLMPAWGQTVRVLKFSEAPEFKMGKVTSRRIVHPEMGAKKITLNFSASEAGNEFSQHVHDGSDDTILCFKGEADLRQGDSRRRFHAGQAVFVPAGEVHGTITTSPGTEMISFQTPPDMALYTGARDSSLPGAAAPKGKITPGAVKYVEFASKTGFFVGPEMGAKRVAVARRVLAPGEEISVDVRKDAEHVIFLWQGALEVSGPAKPEKMERKDALFAAGPSRVKLRNASKGQAILIHAQTPPEPARSK